MANRDDVSTLLTSASLVLVGGAVNSLATLVERAVIGRSLSPGAYGDVSIGLALLSFAVTVSLVGFYQGIPRYVSRFDDERDVRGAWLTGLVVAGVVSLVFAGGLALGGDVLADLLLEGVASTRLLRLFAVAIPFVVGMRVGIGAIRGLENTRYRTYANDLLYPVLRIVTLIVLLRLGAGVLAPGYAYIVGAAAAFVAAHVLLDRLVPVVGAVRTHARELLVFSTPLMFSTLVSVMLTWTDTLMLGYFRSSYEVGLYGAAYPLANGMLIILSSFGYLYLPLASRLDAGGKREEVTEVYQLTTKWIFIVTFPAFLAFVAFPGDVMSAVFGPEYRAGAAALAILSVGFFTQAAAGRNRETLSALGDTRAVLTSNAIAFGLNVALNLALIPRFGFFGAAVASAASFVTLNVVVYVILTRRHGIALLAPPTVRTFAALPVALMPIALVTSRWVSLSALTLPVFLVVAGAATVVVVLLAGCLQREDEIAIEFVEDRLGVRVPFVRRWLPGA